ncbi:MAG: fibronectin type III domain-containing protein, partial [Actinomycetota bacterium]|nr:fibronectin type III domain-containing protein [Actinomycetota bacterium]
ISLTWGQPAHTGGVSLTGFDVYRGTGGTMAKIATVPASAGAYLDESPPLAVTTYYVVYAVNSFGQGPPSPQVACSAAGLEVSCLNS